MHKFIDYTGVKFDNTSVISFSERRKRINPDGSIRHIHFWNVMCRCGRQIQRSAQYIKNDRPCKMCSIETFLNSSHRKNNNKIVNPHKKRLRNIWGRMKDRCYNTNHISYKYYGNCGILVCNDWLYSFASFFEWALSNGYKPHLTIDRINGRGNYEPNNCRWGTRCQQQANRKDNIKINFNGELRTPSQIAEITGNKYNTEYQRAKKIIKNII